MSDQVHDGEFLLAATHRKGNTLEDTVKAYDDWANSYEADVNPSNYSGAVEVSNVVVDQYHLAERKDLKILDVGAGTGVIGVYLTSHFFKHIDALEPSKKMLEKLKEKNIYQKMWHDSVGYHQTEIPDDYYDCIVSSGTFGEGHIPVVGVYEMLRVLKPGGKLIISIREENLTKSSEYAKLEPTFEELKKENKIEQISRTHIKRYWYFRDGVIFVHKKL